MNDSSQRSKVAEAKSATIQAIENCLLKLPQGWHGQLQIKLFIQDGIPMRAEVTPTESIKLCG